MIEYLTVCLVVAALAIGLIICYEDFKFSKIRNKWIKLGLIVGLVIYLAQIIYLLVVGNFVWQPYANILINTLLAFVLGFILWFLKLWAGGDAKLFTLFVFLLPVTYYVNFNYKFWSPLALLINIILPIFLYLLIKFLIYPFQLLFNYLKNPRQLGEYFGKFKPKLKFDKKTVRSYLATALSFVVIFILFQILRERFFDLLRPYLGNLVMILYFFLGFVVWQPLRNILQKQLVPAAILIGAYFILGAIYFPGLIYSDIHKLLAWQFIFMLSFFYVFKYGKTFGLFLYNSAEVKVVPVNNLQSGVYLNKDYIRQVMGQRGNWELWQKEVAVSLSEQEQVALRTMVKGKVSNTNKDNQLSQIVSLFYKFRPQTIFYLLKQLYSWNKIKKKEADFLSNLKTKLNDRQAQQLDNILNRTDEVKEFLKSIKGKLTQEQAEKLKQMIAQRNEEIKAHGLAPIENIVLHKTFSFAPFMLLGVIITLITKSSLIHLIYQWLGR